MNFKKGNSYNSSLTACSIIVEVGSTSSRLLQSFLQFLIK